MGKVVANMILKDLTLDFVVTLDFVALTSTLVSRNTLKRRP